MRRLPGWDPDYLPHRSGLDSCPSNRLSATRRVRTRRERKRRSSRLARCCPVPAFFAPGPIGQTLPSPRYPSATPASLPQRLRTCSNRGGNESLADYPRLFQPTSQHRTINQQRSPAEPSRWALAWCNRARYRGYRAMVPEGGNPRGLGRVPSKPAAAGRHRAGQGHRRRCGGPPRTRPKGVPGVCGSGHSGRPAQPPGWIVAHGSARVSRIGS
jgi:hypothetical protein